MRTAWAFWLRKVWAHERPWVAVSGPTGAYITTGRRLGWRGTGPGFLVDHKKAWELAVCSLADLRASVEQAVSALAWRQWEHSREGAALAPSPSSSPLRFF